MTTIHRLADLRELPRVGRVYLVPVVEEVWCGKRAAWPVLGPMHTDQADFQFPWPHYHVDARFVSRAMLRGTSVRPEWIAEAVGRAPLSGESKLDGEGAWRPHATFSKGRPVEKPLRCIRASVPYLHHDQPAVQALNSRLAGCVAIRKADGRRLCPHRKVDLSTLPVAADGTVVCPLHGLVVRLAA